MSEQFDASNDFEKLLFANLHIRELIKHNLDLRDEICDFKDAISALRAQLASQELQHKLEINALQNKLSDALKLGPQSKALLLKEDFIHQLKTDWETIDKANKMLHKQLKKVSTELFELKRSLNNGTK
jgi:chaperonin cofactor prefoldin